MRNQKGFTLVELVEALIVAAILGILVAIITPQFGYCAAGRPNKPSADEVQKIATEKSLSEAQRMIGMPAVKNFQQRKLMKLIYELCDREDLICYAYLKSDYTGNLTYLGKCIGYGIPFSAQFTNPEKIAHKQDYNGGSFGTLPQADPNGLFMPTSSSATWLMMVDPNTNKPRPVYIEPEIVVSPFKLNTEG